MTKKIWMLLLLLLPISALAADLSEHKVVSAFVDVHDPIRLIAPYSGVIQPYAGQMGDEVRAGEILMRLDTVTLTSPEDGEITAVYLAPGEDARAALLRYSAVLAMDSHWPQILDASTNNAYNDEQNKRLHVGETLYFKSTKSGKTEGFGVVTSVAGKKYTVEIQKGTFDLDEQMNLYRSDDYKDKERVGRGDVRNKPPILLSASGVATEVLVQPGDRVRQGQPLMRFTAGDADLGAAPSIVVPEDAVVIALPAQSGQMVYKGQLLAELAQPDHLEVVAEVDEIDLAGMEVGDFLPVTLDMYPDQQVQGQVTKISHAGYTKQNAAYFHVHLQVSGIDLRYGASASVYLEREE